MGVRLGLERLLLGVPVAMLMPTSSQSSPVDWRTMAWYSSFRGSSMSATRAL